MPKVGRLWWPNWVILSVALPRSRSIRCPAPKRCPVRSAADISFCAATVPSQSCGGARQVSQLPQAAVVSPKCWSSTLRRFAGTTGAAGLLVVGLEALGQVEMGDEAHVGLVDTHAEGDRRYHDDGIVADEALLVRAARRRIQPGVVGQGVDALLAQPGGRLVDLAPRQAVDDAGVAAMSGEKIEQLAARVVALDDRVADVRPVEAG